jgi:ATP/ADP translocase
MNVIVKMLDNYELIAVIPCHEIVLVCKIVIWLHRIKINLNEQQAKCDKV